jgi:hypothetical protein
MHLTRSSKGNLDTRETTERIRLNRKALMIVISQDLVRDIGPEIDFAKSLYSLLNAHFPDSVDILSTSKSLKSSSFMNHSPMLGFITMAWYAVFGNRLALLRAMFSSKIVFTVSLPVTAMALAFRRAFGLNTMIIAPFNGAPSGQVIAFLHRIIVSFVCSRCEAVVSDRLSSMWTTVARYSRHPIALPNVLFVNEPSEISPPLRETMRKRLGIRTQYAVGLIGPFTGSNNMSLNYVIQNYAKFDQHVTFVFLGDAEQSPTSDSRMIFTGRVPDLLSYLPILDCLLIPRFHSTKSPMSKMIYSMKAGVPVVTNNPENLPVINGRDALLGDLDQLPTLVNLIIHDKNLGEQIVTNAKSLINKFYKNQGIDDLVDFIRNELA